jgi:hypothetical protein
MFRIILKKLKMLVENLRSRLLFGLKAILQQQSE